MYESRPEQCQLGYSSVIESYRASYMKRYTFSIRIDGSWQRSHLHFGLLLHIDGTCSRTSEVAQVLTSRVTQSHCMAMHADHVAGPMRLILLQTNVISCRTTSSDMRLPSCCRLRLTCCSWIKYSFLNV